MRSTNPKNHFSFEILNNKGLEINEMNTHENINKYETISLKKEVNYDNG